MARVDAEPNLRPGLAVVRLSKPQRIPSYKPIEGAKYRSPIREILEVAGKPGIDSVAGGLPLNATLSNIAPKLGRRVAFHMEADHAAENNYGGAAGDPDARKAGAGILKMSGIDVDWKRVYVSPAATPAITALAEATLPYDKGIAIVDGPTYPGGIGGLWKRRPEFKQIRMDTHGPLPEDLEAALMDAVENPEKPNVVWYTTLTGNTVGVTASAERRQTYADIIQRFAAPDMLGRRLVVIEDDPYPDINMSGKPVLRPLTSLLLERGLDEQAAYIRTLSKSVTPASRTGFVMPPPHVADDYLTAAENLFLFANRPFSLAVADVYNDGTYAEHVASLGDAYQPNSDVMDAALTKHAQEAQWTWDKPSYGFFYGVHVLPEEGKRPPDMDALFSEILANKQAAYVPLKRLYVAEDPDGTQAAGMRMALSYPPDQIERAVAQTAHGIAEARENARRGN
ncbi:MAG: hypothetical protein KGJ07_02090 [Patescibacteria group bacterium]|nr:hypothetical protein [Patescibacteria group bacterium]